jgi:hypothetical protein
MEFNPNFTYAIECNGSRDSVVSIASGYELDSRGVGVRIPVESRIFSSPRRPYRFWSHPASYQIGTGNSLPGGKATGA